MTWRAHRAHPRIAAAALCTEICDDDVAPRHSIAVELSPEGLRVQRPVGGRLARELQVEIELPGVDELLWAGCAVRFDEVWRVPESGEGRPSGVLRTTGLRIVSAAARHHRLLREYVMDTWRSAPLPDSDSCLLDASCYRWG